MTLETAKEMTQNIALVLKKVYPKSSKMQMSMALTGILNILSKEIDIEEDKQ